MAIKDQEFQQNLLKKLRSGEPNAYEDASIYTILLDLVEGNGIKEVANVFDLLAKEMDLGEIYFMEKIQPKSK